MDTETSKKYLWTQRDSDSLCGTFDSKEAAADAARLALVDTVGPRHVIIFDARPAIATDADLFDDNNVDLDEGGCDISQPNWFEGKWVPENIVLQFKVQHGGRRAEILQFEASASNNHETRDRFTNPSGS